MKILIVTSSYFPHIGGLETVVREIASRMQQQGHEIRIVTNRYPRHLQREEILDDLSVQRFFFLYPQWSQIKNQRIDLFLMALVLFPITLFQLFSSLRAFRPDVVNIHYPNDQTPYLWLLHHILSFRLVVSLHGGDVDGEPHRSRSKRWLFRAITQRADHVTACSQNLLSQAVDLESTIVSKSSVIHNGVYADIFLNAAPYPHPRRYVLGVGRVEHHKGFDTLVEAFAQIVEQLPDIDLLIAGDGGQLADLQTYAQTHKLTHHVHFVGRVDREKVAALMRGADVIVIPSRREPFGIVGVEAMATGRPIISAQVGGLVEAMHGADVTWIAPDDVSVLAEALTATFDSPTAASLEHNRQLATQQNWETVTENYLTVLAR